MRILHVTTFLQGGAGRVIADLAIEQRQARHEVIVVSDGGRQPGYASYPEYLERLGSAGVELHTLRSTFTRDVPLNVDAAGVLSRLIGSRRIDVVHAHAAIPAMVARLAGGSRATPIVVTMHGWGIAKTEDHARTDVTLLGLADAVVTPSAALRERLRRLGVQQDAMLVVPYGVNATPPNAIDDRDRSLLASIRARSDRVAFCIGTIGERKNQRLLVQALAQEGCERIQAVFIGEGETAALEAEAAGRGIGGRIHVLGYRAEASRYLRYADVVVLPSRDEGQPLVVLEALRDGVPIVASDIPEMLEALDGGRLGYTFSGGAVAELTHALKRAFSLHGPGRMVLAELQRRHWGQRHRVEQMATTYEGIYAAQAAALALRISPGERVTMRKPA
jgi:glycosyltransferase involved in cell wall biosynthesis